MTKLSVYGGGDGGGGGMKICPRCGAKNGLRTSEPVKCCRCWYQFVRGAEPKKAGRMIHVGEVGEISPAEMEALPKPIGPSIMAEGFPVSIPAAKRCEECMGILPYHQKRCSKK